MSAAPSPPLLLGTQNLLALETIRLKVNEEIINLHIKDLVVDDLLAYDAVITGSIIVPTPISNFQAANKKYVDDIISSLYWKNPCRVATTANITLSGLQTIDGILVNNSDRVLVKNQSIATNNGYYTASSSAWSRTSDMAIGTAVAGFVCIILEGTLYADKPMICINDPPNDIVGTNGLSFTELSPGIESLNMLTAGSQFLVTGSAGTDFTIDSLGSTHTFNIPSASALARGLLTSADWSTFNSKLTSTLNSGKIFVGSGSNIATGVTLSGDATLSSSGVLTLVNTAVTPGTYTAATLTVDSKGRLTAASSGTLAPGGSNTEIQYKSGVSLAGSPNFVFASSEIRVGAPIVQTQINSPAILSSTSSANFNNSFGLFVSNSYAFIPSYSGDSLTSVNTANSTIISTLTDATNLNGARKVFVCGIYAFVTAYDGARLTVINVQNPSSMTVVTSLNDVDLTNANDVIVTGSYAYVTSLNTLVIIEISQLNTSTGFTVSLTKIGTLSITGANSLAISWPNVYISASSAMYVVNVSTPSIPVSLGSFAIVGQGYGIAVNSSVVYVGTDSSIFYTINVQNGALPVILDSITDGTNLHYVTKIVLGASYAYVASTDNNRVTVVNIADPADISVATSLQDNTVLVSINAVFLNGKNLYSSSNGYFASINIYGSVLSGAYIGNLKNDSLEVTGIAQLNGPVTMGSGLQIDNSLFVANDLTVNSSILLSKGTATRAGIGAVTLSANQGIITFTGITLASNAFTTAAITNSVCRVNSAVLANVVSYTGAGQPSVTVTVVAFSSFTITVANWSTVALTGDLSIGFLIF